MKKTIIISGIALIAIISIITMVMYFSYNNQDSRLRASIEAKVNVNQSCYTKMWEIITTQAHVAEKYADDFKEIYPQLIQGRYSKGQGQFMNWIKEHNPNFDTKLYAKLMNSIEGQRETFHTNQEQLQDLSRQHNTLLTVVPSKWFISDSEKIEVPNVINDETVKAFKSNREEKMNLFKKETK